jgi:hypothetical protein
MISRITLSLRKYRSSDEDSWDQDKFNPRISNFQAKPGLRPISVLHRSRQVQGRPGDLPVRFGSYSAQVDTFVALPTETNTGHSQQRERVQFSSFSANVPTPVPPSPLASAPEQSVSGWMFGLGKSLMPERRSALSSAVVTMTIETQSQYSQESGSEFIELDDLKQSQGNIGQREEV